jgi:hypothetical protein
MIPVGIIFLQGSSGAAFFIVTLQALVIRPKNLTSPSNQ